MADKRPDTYLEDDGAGGQRRIWRASSLGSCERALVMCALGHDKAPPPEHIQRAFDAGSAAEDEILRGLYKKGWRSLVPDEVQQAWGRVVGDDGTGQVTAELIVGKYKGVEQVVRCHPDDIALKYKAWPLTDEDGVRVVEAKFLKPGTYGSTVNQARVSRFYSWQTSVEMLATGLGLALVVGWKGDEGQLVDVEVGFYNEPVYSLGQIKARVFRLARLIAEAEGGKMADIACDWAMFPCGYWQEGHDGQEVWRTAADKAEDGTARLELTEKQRQEFLILASAVRNAKGMADKYEAQKREAGERLREWLVEHGGEAGGKYAVGQFTVEYQRREAKPERKVEVTYKATEATEYVVVKENKKAAGSGTDKGEGT